MSVGTIVTIAGYAILGIILLCSFFIGYKRRFIRGSVNFVISLALVVVAYFVTPVISKAILQISVEDKALSQYVVDLIAGIDGVGDLVNKSDAFKSFLESVPLLLANIVVFIVLYLIMRLLGYIIYKVIDVTCLKKAMEKPTYNAKRDKWLGGGLGIVKGLVFVIVAFAPITSLVGMVSDFKSGAEPLYIAKESDASSTMGEEFGEGEDDGSFKVQKTGDIIDEFLPPIVMEIVDGYNKSGLGVVTGAFGVDDLIFDNLVKFDVKGEVITLRKDLMNVAVLYNTFAEFQEAIDNPAGQSFKDANWDAIDSKVKEFLESGFVKGLVTNLMGDLVKNYEDLNLLEGEYDTVFSTLRTAIEDEKVEEYFLHDFKCLYKVVSDAGRGGLLDTLLLGDSKKLDGLLEVKNKETLKKVVDNILSMNILKDAASPVFDIVAEKADVEQLKGTTNNVSGNDWTAFKTSILNIVDDAVELNAKIKLTTLLENPTSLLDLSDDEIDGSFSLIGKLLDDANSLQIFKKGGKSLVENFLNEIIPGNLKVVQGENVSNYTGLFQYLATPVKNIRDLGLVDLLSEEKTTSDMINTIATNLENHPNSLKNAFLGIYKIDAVRNSDLFKEITDMLSETGIDKLEKDSENEALSFANAYANWENDLEQITNLLVNAKKIEIGEEENKKSVLNALLEECANYTDIIDEIPNETEDDANALNGLIRPIFKAKSMGGIVDSIKDSYPEIDNLLGSKDVDNIDFAKLLKATKIIANAGEDSFLKDLQGLVTTSEEVDVNDISTMIANIGDNQEKLKEIRTVVNAIGDYAEDYISELDVIKNMRSEDKTALITQINSNSDLASIKMNPENEEDATTLADKIKEMLGLTTSTQPQGE